MDPLFRAVYFPSRYTWPWWIRTLHAAFVIKVSKDCEAIMNSAGVHETWRIFVCIKVAFSLWAVGKKLVIETKRPFPFCMQHCKIFMVYYEVVAG